MVGLDRVGVGPPPIESPEEWLAIYHGVRDTVASALYRVGLILLDLDNPSGACSDTGMGHRPHRTIRPDRRALSFPAA